MPFWNPWYCGGNVLWQNPQIALLSPVYPLTALMPLALAMKVNILLHYWVGFIGMHLLLSRVVGLRSRPLVFFLATRVHRLGRRRPFTSWPATACSCRRSTCRGCCISSSGRWPRGPCTAPCWAACAIALMVYNGGTHILPMAHRGRRACWRPASAAMLRQWRPLVVGAVCCVAGLAYSAPKLLPVVSFVTSERVLGHAAADRAARSHDAGDGWRGIYLDPDQTTRARLPEQRHGWHEYGNYIGEFAALLIVAGVLWTLTARGAPALLAGPAAGRRRRWCSSCGRSASSAGSRRRRWRRTCRCSPVSGFPAATASPSCCARRSRSAGPLRAAGLDAVASRGARALRGRWSAWRRRRT